MANNFHWPKALNYKVFVRLMAERGARVFTFGLILVTLFGVVTFFLFAWRPTQAKYKGEVRLEVVNESLLGEVLKKLPLFPGSGATPSSPF